MGRTEKVVAIVVGLLLLAEMMRTDNISLGRISSSMGHGYFF